MSDIALTSILDRCLERIAAGAIVSACLASYPEHATELEAPIHEFPRVEPLAWPAGTLS